MSGDGKGLWVQRSQAAGRPWPHGLRLGGDFLCVLSDQQADAIEAQLAAAEDLPEGVAVASDGRMYAPGDVVRTLPSDKWERRMGVSWKADRNEDANPNIVYKVRRRPTPRTERVRACRALGRKNEFGEVIDFVLSAGVDFWGSDPVMESMHIVAVADADGMVTVLTEDGAR